MRARIKPLAVFLVVIGILLLVFPTGFKSFQALSSSRAPLSIAAKSQEKAKSAKASEPIKIDSRLLSNEEIPQPPERIVVPQKNVDLPVVEAKVVNGFWETSETFASHGVGSASPGQNGNVVIFAHARDGLFGPLREIKKDTIVYVLTKDRWFGYRTEEIKLVDPNQVEVIAPTSTETLTLYTCSGFLDSKRLIIKAMPSN